MKRMFFIVTIVVSLIIGFSSCSVDDNALENGTAALNDRNPVCQPMDINFNDGASYMMTPTSSAHGFYVTKIDPCSLCYPNPIFTLSSHLESVYGGSNFIAVRPKNASAGMVEMIQVSMRLSTYNGTEMAYDSIIIYIC